jgi:hypothetical protein
MTTEQIAGLLRFARRCIESAWEGGGFEGDDLQDLAEECGLLEPTAVTAPCNPECCACADYGDFPTTCYRLPAWFKEAERDPITGRLKPKGAR